MIPTIPTIPASQGSVLDYGIDLSPPVTALKVPWLGAGEQVTSLTVTADAGATIVSQNIGTNAGGVAGALCTAWLTGFQVGTSYGVHFAFTTNLGRTDTRSIQINCIAR